MGIRVRRLAAVLLAAAAPGGPGAGQDDPAALLADPAADAAALRERLGALAPALAASPEAVCSPGLVTWSAGDENDRRLFHRKVAEFNRRCREALASLGFSPPEAGALRLAVRVTAAGAVPQALLSADGSAVLFREPPAADAVPRPSPPERYDGPPVLRDLVQGAARGRRWLQDERVRARAQGPGSLGFACARSLAGADGLMDAAPPWVREGLAAWTEARARGEDAPPPHLPAAFAPGAAANPWREILGPGGAVPEGAIPVLGRAMEALLLGKADLPARLSRLASGTPASSPEVFGADPAQAVLAAASRMAPKEEGCRADGTIACPLCRGSGRHTIGCTACEGTGAIPCPSCGGSDICPAPGCESGLFLISDTRGYDCKLCDGYGFVYCFACKDPALKCAACRGSPGKIAVACPLCDRGRLPCPGCPRAAGGPCALCPGTGALACGFCSDGRANWPCSSCGGAGYLGCARCFGFGRHSTNGNSYDWCKECKEGKNPCPACRGRGTEKLTPGRCPFHPGAPPVRPCPACALPPPPPAPGEAAGPADPKVLARAVSFLLDSTDSTGAFGVRYRGTAKAAGRLGRHNLFTNATCLWTLFTVGRTREEPGMAPAWTVLLKEAAAAADSRDTETGTQEAAFALRALLVGGEAPKAKVVQGLVSRLVRSQRPDGLWADDIKTREVRGDVLNALIVVEALRVARDRGVAVPSETWSRAHTAAQRLFSSRKVKAKKGDLLSASEVACCVSLIVLTKAGSLGERAAAFDYRSLPDVKAGLAWLDRHFDVEGKPCYINGARVRRRNMEGYFAYMYSMQRLAMLLGISEFNGRRWYPEGAAHLARVQREDGSFEETGYAGLNWSMFSTASAVLFLVRATTPITEPTSR